MSSKRTYSTFIASASADMLVHDEGFGASELQQQQPALFYTSSDLQIPGQWPEEAPLNTEAETAPAQTSTSFFNTLGKWVATVANITSIFSLPERIAKRFLRKQSILAVPVIRQDGSNKKRLVDAGFADQSTIPSPSVRARANQARRQNMTRATTVSSDVWNSSPHGTHQSPPPRFTSPLSVAPDYYAPQMHTTTYSHGSDDESDEDDSLDFSFENVLTSTPPRNSQTGSPIHISWNSPDILSPTRSTLPQQWHNGSPVSRSWGSPHVQSPVGQSSDVASPCRKALAHSFSASRRSNRPTSNMPSLTPMRRQLIKRQLSINRRRGQASGEAGHQTPENEVENGSAEVVPGDPTDAIADELSNLSPSPLQAHAEFPSTHSNADTLSTRHYADTVPPFEYVNDLSFLDDAPAVSPRKRGVRWAEKAGTKAFYFDERVSEMLDSTLENINFESPAKLPFQEYEDEEVAVGNGEQNPSPSRSATTASSGGSPSKSAVDDGGFHGVPPGTFDASDDSLEESQISVELLEEIQEDFRYKLSLLPPLPPSPPPLQPLISPLGSEEMDALELAAKKTQNGRLSEAWIVQDKLYARDFATLLPGLFRGDPKAWLNDNIVNEYLSILIDHKKKEAGFEHKKNGPAPPVHAFSSFWYSTAQKSIQSVARWGRRFQLSGKQYLDAELILYPICDRGHWRLMAIKPKERTIEYFDSMGLSGDVYITKAKEYLALELGKDYIEDEWTVLRKQRSSQQLNGSDCGVFTLLNSLVLLRGEETNRVLACDGMIDARERIATTLMAGQPTTEME